jgi:hypothetical protein
MAWNARYRGGGSDRENVDRPLPVRLLLRALLAAAAVAAIVPSCRSPLLDGIDFGADSEPFRHERIVDPVELGGELVHRLLLIGDAGAARDDDPVLALLSAWGNAHPERTTTLFLGDNIYPAGLQESDRARGEGILLRQMQATRSRKIFLPGNHEWGFRCNRRITAGVLKNQQDFIDAHADLAVRFEPRDGCPGPAPVELVEPSPALPGGLTLLLLDLHWWLLPEALRPVCKEVTSTTEFVERLREELTSRGSQNVVVAAHHPIRSGGEHGGFTLGFWFDLGTALFYRMYTVQDLIEPDYQEMVGLLSEVLAEAPPLAMVGGHDHNLQILEGGDAARLIVVSGAGSKTGGVTSIEGTLFAHGQLGFVAFDFFDVPKAAQGTLLVQVLEPAFGEEPVAAFGLALARETETPQPVPLEDGTDEPRPELGAARSSGRGAPQAAPE